MNAALSILSAGNMKPLEKRLIAIAKHGTVRITIGAACKNGYKMSYYDNDGRAEAFGKSLNEIISEAEIGIKITKLFPIIHKAKDGKRSLRTRRANWNHSSP